MDIKLDYSVEQVKNKLLELSYVLEELKVVCTDTKA